MHAFCERMNREGHSLHLAYLWEGDYSNNEGGIFQSVTRISTLPIRAQPIRRWLVSLWALVSLCRAHRIDLIVTHVVHAAAMLRVLHLLTGVRLSIYFKWIYDTPLVGRQTRWGLRGFRDAAAVSSFVARYWVRNGVPLECIAVVPEGVEPSSSTGMPQAPGPAETGVNSQSRKLGFAGRIVPEKGLSILFAAIVHLRRQGIETTCFVAGRFDPAAVPYHAKLLTEAEGLGISNNIQFLGFVNPLEPMLREMDLVVIPSTCQDAQPLVLMQSMCEGIPVVASRVGGIPEILTGDLAWLLADPEDPLQLADRIAQVLALAPEALTTLRNTITRRVRDEFSLEQSQQRLMVALGIGKSLSKCASHDVPN